MAAPRSLLISTNELILFNKKKYHEKDMDVSRCRLPDACIDGCSREAWQAQELQKLHSESLHACL